MPHILVSFDIFKEFSVPTSLTVAQLKEQLSRATSRTDITDLYVGDVLLDPNHQVGHAPLVSGAHLSLVPTRHSSEIGSPPDSSWEDHSPAFPAPGPSSPPRISPARRSHGGRTLGRRTLGRRTLGRRTFGRRTFSGGTLAGHLRWLLPGTARTAPPIAGEIAHLTTGSISTLSAVVRQSSGRPAVSGQTSAHPAVLGQTSLASPTMTPGLNVTAQAGRIYAKALPGWKLHPKLPRGRWEPGQIIQLHRGEKVAAYQLRMAPNPKPTLRARLRSIDPSRLVPALVSVAMAATIALLTGRWWILLMGLSFPLMILAGMFGGQGNSSGPPVRAPRESLSHGNAQTNTASASGAVSALDWMWLPPGPLDDLTGPHPCDLLKPRPFDSVGFGAHDGLALSIVAVVGPHELAVAYARGLILAKSIMGRPRPIVPVPSGLGQLREDWMRWLTGGHLWAESVLVLPAGSVVPSWCQTTAVVSPSGVHWQAGAEVLGHTLFCGLTPEHAEALARTLVGQQAGLTGDRAIPTVAYLPGPAPYSSHPIATGPQLTSAAAVLSVDLGVGPHGVPIEFDLVAHGPHALVAGTTGAGKSELLQTLVLGLAARYSPEQVALALVDYKGGAGFSHCAKLPHVVGMVTDLDPGSARRAITGLRDQLRHRERLFAHHEVSSYSEYHRIVSEGPLLPRVVIVVDELRAMVDDEPEFIADLVRLGSQGRSLGIHLVLATQRPNGAITPEMRANLNARLCLRVANAQDSVEVLGTPIAAQVPAHLAGRCQLQVGGGELVEFQTYYAGRFPTSDHILRAIPDTVTGELKTRPSESEKLSLGPGTAPVAHTGQVTEHSISGEGALLSRVHTIAARFSNSPRPDPLWAPALPKRLEFDFWPSVLPAHCVPFGIGEISGNQNGNRVDLDLSSAGSQGNLGIIGPARAGHSTTVRTIMVGALRAGLGVHGIFAPGHVPSLVSLPYTRSVGNSPTHPLLGTLTHHGEAHRIIALFQKLLNPTQPSGPAPCVLLIDSLPALRAVLETHAQGRGWELLLDLFRGAAHLNLTIVFTSTIGVPNLLAPYIGRTLAFITDQAHTDQMLGVPKMWAGTGRIAGRAVLIGQDQPILVQVAHGYQKSALEHDLSPAPSATPTRIPALPIPSPQNSGTATSNQPTPRQLLPTPQSPDRKPNSYPSPWPGALGPTASSTADSTADSTAGSSTELPPWSTPDSVPQFLGTVLNLDGPTAVLEDLAVPTAGSWLIAGPPRSGRSTAALRFIPPRHSFKGRQWTFGLSPNEGKWAKDERSTGNKGDHPGIFAIITKLEQAQELLNSLESGGDREVTAVIEGVDNLMGANPQLVQRLVDRLMADGHRVIATTLIHSLSQPRALPPQLSMVANGIVLMPSQRVHMNFLGHPIEHLTDPPQFMPGGAIIGRGVVVTGGRAQAIQIAEPDADYAESGA